MRFGETMGPAVRGLLSHLAGFAAPHVVMATVLAAVAAATFTPTLGGESSSAFEAANLQLFIAAALLACTAAGYACAISLVAQQHAVLRLPSMFGVIAGAVTFTVAAVGIVNRVSREAGLSVFLALAILGFIAGVASSALVVLAARLFPKRQRA